MLQTNKEHHLISAGDPELYPSVSSASPSPAEQLDFAIGFARRQYILILLCLLVALTVGALYLLTTPPSFMASASMIIDTRRGQIQQSIMGDSPIDAAWIESQIATLKSDNIASAVIKKLHLTEDPEFVGSGQGRLRALLGVLTKGLWPGSGAETNKLRSESDLMIKATAAFERKLTPKRLGISYVIEISFLSQNPDRAAQIANAVADAYIEDQWDAKYQANRRASDWLQERIQALREQALAAEGAVVDFKTKNNIVAADGKLISEQHLTQLNSQLVVARAQTTEAQARLNRIEAVLRANRPDATVNSTVSDTLNNQIITKLRSQYLELVSREAEWSARYGRNHLAVVNLRNQIRDIRNSIVDELRRIAETYKSDYEIAKHRQEEVEKQLAELVTLSQGANQAQILLRGLESSAQSYRTLYDTFQQRYMESVQQQSFPIMESRLISPASPPLEHFHPKTTLVLALACLGGMVLGVGLGMLREVMERVFRTSRQVRSALDAECLALIPLLKNSKPKTSISDEHPSTSRMIRSESNPFRTVIEFPLSRFAEGIRSIKLAADLSGDSRAGRVIGFTSALPGEGKSTLAAAFAQLAAQVGGRVILVDGDLRNPTLSMALAADATAGLVDVMQGSKSLEDTIWNDPSTNMAFLPTIRNTHLPYTSEILGSPAAKSFFSKLREDYNYVVVDLSPLAPIVDVRATTQWIDAYIVVVKWGHTKIDVVQHGLNSAPGVQQNLLGVVLNQTDFDLLRRYEGPRTKYYYNKQFARYGYTD